MINIADLPAVRAQLARDAAATKETQTPLDGSSAADEQSRTSLRPDLALSDGKYYVIDRQK